MTTYPVYWYALGTKIDILLNCGGVKMRRSTKIMLAIVGGSLLLCVAVVIILCPFQ